MRVSKRFSFCAAHYLPGYKGKCSNMHGHTWDVEVACDGEVNKTSGMVIDFLDLKKFCEGIKSYFDHSLLNDLKFIENPTAENICTYIFEVFEFWCRDHSLKVGYVRVWEAEDSMVEKCP